MRIVDIVRASALIGSVALLSACPKKDAEAVPEPAPTGAQPTAASDKAGAEAPAAAVPAAPAATPAATPEPQPAAAAPVVKAKKKEDPGGW